MNSIIHEYIELLLLILTAVWTAYQQWLHGNHERHFQKLEKFNLTAPAAAPAAPQPSTNPLANMTDLREQRKLQEMMKNGTKQQ